jgi:hypothetical protein
LFACFMHAWFACVMSSWFLTLHEYINCKTMLYSTE